MKRSRTLFLLLGLVAAVAVGLVYLNVSGPHDETQGAIGAVKKHRDPQITDADVILGNEQRRTEENLLYRDYLKRASQLRSLSFAVASAAKELEARSPSPDQQLADLQNPILAVQQQLASQATDLQQRSLGLLAMINDNIEIDGLENVEPQLAQIQASLESAAPRLDAKLLESLGSQLGPVLAQLGQINANHRSLLGLGQLNANNRSILEAGPAGAISLAQAARDLESISMELAQKEQIDSVRLESFHVQLGNLAKALESQMSGDSSCWPKQWTSSYTLDSAIQQLGVQFLQMKALEHARVELAGFGVSALDAADRLQLDAISAALASQASALESLAAENMAIRFASHQLEAQALAQMSSSLESMVSEMAQMSSRSPELAPSLESFQAALASVQKAVASRHQDLAQRALGSMQAELAAASSHLDNRSGQPLGVGYDLGIENRLSSKAADAIAVGIRAESHRGPGEGGFWGSRGFDQLRLASHALGVRSLDSAMSDIRLAAKALEAKSAADALGLVSKALENATLDARGFDAIQLSAKALDAGSFSAGSAEQITLASMALEVRSLNIFESYLGTLSVQLGPISAGWLPAMNRESMEQLGSRAQELSNKAGAIENEMLGTLVEI